MQAITELALLRSIRGVFTRMEAGAWAGGSAARIDALIKRAVAAGEVIRLRRGLYCIEQRFIRHRPNPFEVCQRIYGPSYVSLESALSWHGWIPEAVRAITSVSIGRSCSFINPLGLFTYSRVPQKTLMVGVGRRTESDGAVFFLAHPLKALADYVHRLGKKAGAKAK